MATLANRDWWTVDKYGHQNSRLVEAVTAIVRWDDAEKTALPYDNDGGRAFRERIRLCDDAMTKARAALAANKEME